jgi:hypothetical protein
MSQQRKMVRVSAVTVAALIAAGAMSSSGPLLLGGGEAHAVVGRPLTPISYAGVARRTTRRAVAAGAYAGGYAAGSVITTLPAGCTRVMSGGTAFYNCGTAQYRPYYDGPTVVYQVVP